MDSSEVCGRSHGSQTEAPTARSSQTAGQASSIASNSNTTGPSVHGTTTTTTTVPSDASAGIPMPTTSAMPANVTTGAVIPVTTTTTTAVPSNTLTGIPTPSCASTPSVMNTNVITGTSPTITVPVGVAATPSTASAILSNNVLPQNEIHRHLNIYAVQVLIPNCFLKILEWGCPEKNIDTLYKYITVTKKLSHTNLKNDYKFSGDDLKKLQNEKPSDMDGPLLRKVIRATCTELKEEFAVWKGKDEGQMECLIEMLTECRNKVCHEIKTAAISSTLFDEIIRLLKKLIQVGGNLYQLSSIEIDEALKQLQDNIDIVTNPEYERDLILLQLRFHTTGYSETKSYWEKYCTQDIHLYSNVPTTHADNFYPLDVLLKSSNTHNRPMSYRTLFDGTGDDDKRPVLIVQGEAGSGKSTLLKEIAMQFFKLTKDRMPSLGEFHLLHFLQCNNQIFNSLEDFISNYFPETCKIISPKDALRCFPYLGNLILIDGYDEVNIHSVRVTKAFIAAYKNNPACQIVFTARPSAVPDLEDLLTREGVQFHIYQLLEISREENQLKFLQPLDRDLGLCEAFSALAYDVKSFFVRPINLIQFSSLFLDSPDKVKKWSSINDVMQDIMSLYKALITSKLNNNGIKNLPEFVEEVFQKLCDFAFKGLIKRIFTMDERACATLRGYCYEKIKQRHLEAEVDSNDILSVVYVTKVNPTNDAVPAYQYSHKSMQELMSACSLLNDLTLHPNMTLEELIRSRIRNIEEPDENLQYNVVSDGLLNVYKFVVRIFSAPDKRPYLLRWLPELETALTTARADWQDVMMSCDRPAKTEQDEVAKIAAKQKLAASGKWEARTARDVRAIARMLPHEQPDELDVKLPESEGTPSELMTILNIFRGYLSLTIRHSFETYTNCDHILDTLNSSCSVTSLAGCLASSSVATRNLSVTLKQPGARLDLTLDNPSLHALQELEENKHTLNVRMKHHNPPTARPLPRGFMPPLLIVEDTPDSGVEELKAAILHYAPEGSVYFSLWLENTLLDDAAIQRLLKELEEADIRTYYHCGKTCFTVAHKISAFCMHCRKAHTDASQRCVWLQLATKRKEEGEEANKGDFGGKGDGEEAGQRDFKVAQALQKDEDHENLNPISLDDLSRFGCIQVINSIVPDIMRRVIDWGCRKPAVMTFLEYISKRMYKLDRNFPKTERQMLNKTVLDDGVTVYLMYHLIPLVCENLSIPGTPPWMTADCSSVEGLLKSIMSVRNDIIHLTLNVDAYLSLLRKFEDLCTKLVIAAGTLYAIDRDTVVQELANTRCKFYKVRAWGRDFKASKACKTDKEQENLNLIWADELTRFCGHRVMNSIVPDVMKRVIDWGCSKPPYMTFGQYIPPQNRKSFRQLYRILDKTELGDDLDVTSLYQLIPLLCEFIARPGSSQWAIANSSSVEGLLTSIKNTRNNIVHSTHENYEYFDHLRNFEDHCTKLIIAAGELYGVNMNSVEEEVTTTRFQFFKVREGCFMYSPASSNQ